MSSRAAWAALALAMASGCVNVTPTVKTDVPPDPHTGYVAGAFSNQGTRGAGFGFWLVGPGNQEVVLAFDGAVVSGSPSSARLGMVSVPPGEYRVASWVTFSMFHEILKKSPIPTDHGLARSFVVKEGHVVFLGSFGASTTRGFGRTTFTIQPEPTGADQVPIIVRNGYPRFAAAPLECLLCSAPPPGAKVDAAMPAIAPARKAQD